MNDPANYRKMCEPFENEEAASAALAGFVDEVREVRNKWKIRDVTLAMAVNIKSGDVEGGEVSARATAHVGSSHERLDLAAYGLGVARSETEQYVRATETLGKEAGRLRRPKESP